MDAGGQVRREDPVDLVVAEFLGGTEDSETGVADQNIDAPEIGDGAFDDGPQGGGVADVEHFDPEQVGVLLAEVGDRARSADRTDDTITSTEQLFGEVTPNPLLIPVINQMRSTIVIVLRVERSR